MKHGLKQEIKRGLSVLMAVSMVASSALPVMAEEVVEEAVEVEVVSEEVADEAEDVVVDVAEDTEVVEEVIDGETVVEEAAEDLSDPYEKDNTHTHTVGDVKNFEVIDKNNDGKFDTGVIYYGCAAKTDCTFIDKVEYNLPTTSYFSTGEFTGSAGKFVITISSKNFTTMDCSKNQAGTATYLVCKWGSTPIDDTAKALAYSTVTQPVVHTPDTGNQIITKAATCSSTGIRTYKCSVSGCNYTAQNEVLKMNPHVWVARDFSWSSDGKSASVLMVCNQNDSYGVSCSHSEKIDLSSLIKENEVAFTTPSKPTCTTNGTVFYYIDPTAAQNYIKTKLGERTTTNTANLLSNDTFDFSHMTTNQISVSLKKLGHKITDVSFNFIGVTVDGAGNAVTGYCAVNAKCANENCPGTGLTVNVPEAQFKKASLTLPTCKGNSGSVTYHVVAKIDGVEYDSLNYNTTGSTYTISSTNTQLQHTYNNAANRTVANAVPGTVTKQPTCTEAGVGTFKCAICGALSTETAKNNGGTVTDIPALKHDLAISTTYNTPLTCTQAGVFAAKCNRCQKTLGRTGGEGLQYSVTSDGVLSGAAMAFISEEQQKALVDKNKAHKFVVKKAEWSDKYCTITVECKCGATAHVSNGPSDATSYKGVGGNWATVVSPTIAGTEKIDKEATALKEGSKHYEATFTFKDDFGKEWTFSEKSANIVIPAKGGQEKATVSITGKTVTYNGDRQHIVATTNSDVKPVVSYYRDAALTEKFSGAPYTAGTYYVKATVAASKDYTAAESEVVKLVIEKADPKVTISWKADKDDATKANITVKQKNIGAQKGNVKYKAKNSKIKVDSNGVVSFTERAKKGTKYKVIITVKPTTNYNGYERTIKVYY